MNDSQGADDVVVVTGASAGLGKALCIELIKHGVRVAAFARSAPPLQALADAAPDGQLLPVVVDVADGQAVSDAFAKVRAKFGSITTLVNNAAVYPRRDILEETPETFMRTVQVNLGGMVACTDAALKDMVMQGRGRIVNITSYAGMAPTPLASAYSVSKGATRIYTNALIADLGDRFPGIVINEWLPGALNTQMGIPDGISPEDAARWGANLVLMEDSQISGVTFERDRSVPPPMGLKRRVLNRILQRKTPLILLG